MVFVQEENIAVPESLRNNVFFRESMRQTNLARLSLIEGDYSASIHYSERALHYARLSDEFVTDNIIAAADRRIKYAASINAAVRYPSEFSLAQAAYSEAIGYRIEESWNDAIGAANRVLTALASVQTADRLAQQRADEAARLAAEQRAKQAAEESARLAAEEAARLAAEKAVSPLPARYTVRTWEGYRDCLWNIAGLPWVYNDPHRWRLLFDANKSRMPDPNNPDLIRPGMVLDIPGIRGEIRQGMWDPNATYPPLPK